MGQGKSPFGFVSASAFIHGAILIGLVMIPALKLLPFGGNSQDTSVEIISGETGTHQDAGAPQSIQASQPNQNQEAADKADKVVKAETLPAKKVVAPVAATKAAAVVASKPQAKPSAKAAAIVDADDSALAAEVAAADQEAETFAKNQKPMPVKETQAQSLESEDEVLDQTAAAAATAAVTEQKSAEPLAAPKTNPPAETMSQVESQSASSSSQSAGGSGVAAAAGEELRSYLDLKQQAGNRAPQYPDLARRRGDQGEVVLNYFVTSQGAVKDVRIAKSSGSRDLDQEALKAVSRYRYVPGQEGWTEHPVMFSLKGSAVPQASRLRTAGQSAKSGSTQD